MDLFENLNEIDIISDYDLYNEIDDLKNEIKQEGGNILDIINQNNGTENNMTFLKNLKEYNNYLINQLGGAIEPPTAQSTTAQIPTAQHLISAASTQENQDTENKPNKIQSLVLFLFIPFQKK